MNTSTLASFPFPTAQFKNLLPAPAALPVDSRIDNPVPIPEVLLEGSVFLAEMLPQSIVAALGESPKRLLFRNECVQLVLAGLRRGQQLEGFLPGTPLLLCLAFGKVAVRTQDSQISLSEGEQLRLEPGVKYDVRALVGSDLLFFIPTAVRAYGSEKVTG